MQIKISESQGNQIYRWIYFALLALAYLWIKFQYHEIWKDEWQAWLITRDLPFGELLGQLYYEGHPSLWYLYLKPWTLFPGNDVLIFQIAHAIPSLLVFYLVVFRFRLSLWLSFLIPAGFFMFFEYGLVNRGYVLVMLLAFFMSIELSKKEARPWALGILALLLCQTEVYGLFMTGAFGLYYMLRLGWKQAWNETTFKVYFAGSILGGLLFLLTVFPKENVDITANAYPDQPFATDHLATVFQGTHVNTYWLGAVPDTNAFGSSSLGIILSFLVLGLLIFLFRKNKPVLAAFLLFQTAFFFFSLLVYPGGVRHWGCALVFWIALLPLIAREQPKLDIPQFLIILSILGFQLYYLILGLNKEIRYPFTNAKAVAEYIKTEISTPIPVLGMNKFLCTPVVGYLDRPVYALPEGEPFSFFRWAEKIYVPPPQELELFAQYKQSRQLLVVNGDAIDTNRYPNLKFIKSFESYSIKNESFYLYILTVQE